MGAAFLPGCSIFAVEKIMEKHSWMHPRGHPHPPQAGAHWDRLPEGAFITHRPPQQHCRCKNGCPAASGDPAVTHGEHGPRSTALLLPRPPHMAPPPPRGSPLSVPTAGTPPAPPWLQLGQDLLWTSLLPIFYQLTPWAHPQPWGSQNTGSPRGQTAPVYLRKSAQAF